LEGQIVNKIIIAAVAVSIGLTSCRTPPTFLFAPTAAQEPVPETPVYRDVKKVPIAVYQIRVAIAPGTVIGRATRGLFGIVTQEWYVEEIGDASSFIDRVYRSLKKAGYTPAIDVKEGVAAGTGSIFGDITSESSKPTSPQARFMVGGTITKTWMSAGDNGWGGWATDVDMKVTWEVYDTLQNKVILTQETYAVDEGGGITAAYYYTVMEKAAAKFFNSSEFKEAIEKNLAYNPGPTGTVQPNAQAPVATVTEPMNSVIKVQAGGSSHASGFALNYQGQQYIVTNYHVIANAPTILVKTRDGRSFPASVVASNAPYDLALLSVPRLQLPGLELNTEEPELGTPVQVLGNPAEAEFVTATGNISRIYREGELRINIRRPFGSFVNGRNVHVLYQIDAPIAGGNSGGPVIDANNRVIGIVSWGESGKNNTFILPAGNIINCFNLKQQ
jgi:S1-C subfamily serine protease